MEDLQKKSGLEFEIGENKLIYSKDDYEPAVDWEKTFEAGKYAYNDQESDFEMLYYGARYSEKKVDEKIFIENDVMADLTVLNAGKVGNEFIKTVGHYHGLVHGTNIAYPEVYEAVTEKWEYLLQSELDENGEVEVVWVVTEPGDKVVMMPGYGHVSINVGEQPAAEIDLQKRDNPNNSIYEMFKEKVGGAIYRTEKGLEPNPNYKVKSLRVVKPKEKPEWGLTKDVPLYTSFVRNPEKFQWLLRPQDFEFNVDELFEDVKF